MLLVEEIVECGEGALTCVGRIPLDNPFVVGGRAPAFVGLEVAAQTAAVFEALGRAGSGEGPRIGYLVSVRGAVFSTADLPAGESLIARVRASGSAPPLALYEVSVEALGQGVLTATLGAYIADPRSAS